jgi:SAM-dependent methyltransferase
MNSYSGTANLEVMASAVNYNEFLTQLVLSSAKPGDRVLDFGAGIGTFAKRVREAGYSITCVEPDACQSDQVARMGIHVVRQLDEIRNQSVDYIYTLNVLEHIEDDVATLRELGRKLSPGGRLLIYVPAFEVLFSSMDRRVGHHRRYTLSGLKAAVEAAGLSTGRGRYADCLGFFASLVYRFLGDDGGRLDERALVMYDRIVFPLSRGADIFFSRFLGKNVSLVATRPDLPNR